MPKVPTKLELGKVLSEMAARDMNMRALDGSLQERPEAFKGVHMMPVARPFFGRVVHRAMLVAEPRELRVGLEFIRADRRTPNHVANDVRFKRDATDVLDNASHDIAATFGQAENRGFAERRPSALALPLSANHRFVGFHVARKRRIAVNLGKVLADFMAHAPRRFVIHGQLALQFLRRNAVASRGEEIHRVIPLLQWRMRAMEDRSRHRVNVLAALAGIGGHFRELAKLAHLAATRAFKVRAVPRLEQMLKASVIIGKQLHELLDRKGRPSHDPNSVALKAT